ncbi:MAG: pilus assembly protein TadG-related protein [Myxococcota bacterium]
MSYVVHSALLAVPVLGFCSLAVDLSRIEATATQLQFAADSAALAAAAHTDEPAYAMKIATVFAAANDVGGSPGSVAADEVEVGRWDGETWTRDDFGTFVRVTARVTSRPTILAGMIGAPTFDLARTAIASASGSGGPCAMIGLAGLSLTGGGSIDSYDSTAGPYKSGSEAGVCSNATAMTVSGVSVNGDVHPGVGGTVAVSSAKVSGNTNPLSHALAVASPTKPAGAKSLPATSKGAIKLDPGTYYLKGKFQVSAATSITLTGPTNLYVEGEVEMNGAGLINKTGDPHQLTLYVIGAQTVQLNDAAAFYGSLIAPSSSVSFDGSASMYGLVIAGKLKIDGKVSVHLDTSLPAAVVDQTLAALVR